MPALAGAEEGLPEFRGSLAQLREFIGPMKAWERSPRNGAPRLVG